jgi:hypothetical protein
MNETCGEDLVDLENSEVWMSQIAIVEQIESDTSTKEII